MVVLHRPMFKTHDVSSRFGLLVNIILTFLAEVTFDAVVLSSSVQCSHRNVIYDELYQNDNPIYEEILMNPIRGEIDTTVDPFEDFESFFAEKVKKSEKYPSSSPNPKRKSGLKHHRHRHRGRKNQHTTTQSFESLFKSEEEEQRRDYNFLYEDQELRVKNDTYDYLYGFELDRHRKHKSDPYSLNVFSSEYLIDPSPQELMILPSGLPHLEIPWPVKKEAVVEGDVNLGGLMMVHSREDGVTCGPIMPQGGIQALEAMLFTLDIINKKLKLVPNVTIGAHILDDCDKDTYGLEMAVDFIKGKSFSIILILLNLF